MATQEQNSTLTDLLPDTIVELYEIDLGQQDGLKRFHSGSVATQDLVFDGHVYLSIPVDASGFESRSDGQLPRPRILFANPQGIISDAIKTRKDLVGNTFIRKRIFLKNLDSVNFTDGKNPFGDPDPESRFDDDFFIVNRKTNENKIFVEFELSSPLEIENIKLPARLMIANYCPWIYRGIGCKYGKRKNHEQKLLGEDAKDFFGGTNLGIPIADENDKVFSDPDGYNITSFTWRKTYDTTVSYSIGDVVRVRPKFTVNFNSSYDQVADQLDSKPDMFFVCIQANDSSNIQPPKIKSEFWASDQCSKTLNACTMRYILAGELENGLPFGGFPSTEVYRYNV